jgi:WD40 repeat protein
MDDVAWQHLNKVQVKLPSRVKMAVKTHKGQATCARYNTAGNLIVSGGVDSMVRILDPRTGSLRAVLRGAKQSVMNVCFSPDDRFVLSAGNDKVARVYRMDSPEPLHMFSGHTNKIYAGTFTMVSFTET